MQHHLVKCSNWLVLTGLVTSFFVMMEPAPTDILMLGAAVIAMLAGRRASRGIYAPALFGGIYLIFTIAASLGTTVDQAELWKAIFVRFYLLISIYSVAAYLTNAEWPQTESLIRAMIIAGLVCSGIVVLAKFKLLPHSEIFFRDQFMVRMKGTFKDPNVMGPFLATSLMLALFRLYETGNRQHLWAAALICVSIVLSGSRGALMTVVLQTGVFLATIWPDKTWNPRPAKTLGLTVLAVAILAGGSLALISLGGFKEQLAARLEVQSYDTNRFAAQSETLAKGLSSPLGHGASAARRISDAGVDPHNVYLKVLYEAGLFGLFGFIGLAAASAWRALATWRDTRNTPRVRLLGAAVFATLIAHYVNSLFIDSTHWRHLFVLVGIAAGFPVTVQAPLRPWRAAPQQ